MKGINSARTLVPRAGIVQFVLCPRIRHYVALIPARIDPPRQTGEVELHELVDGGGIEARIEGKMKFLARTVTAAGPAHNVKGMLWRCSVCGEEVRVAPRVAHQGIVPPASPRPVSRYANHDVEVLASSDTVLNQYARENLLRTPSGEHTQVKDIKPTARCQVPEKKIVPQNLKST
jgi:hypothetical protein